MGEIEAEMLGPPNNDNDDDGGEEGDDGDNRELEHAPAFLRRGR